MQARWNVAAPLAGDIAFFDLQHQEGRIQHVGIVESVTECHVVSIDGIA